LINLFCLLTLLLTRVIVEIVHFVYIHLAEYKTTVELFTVVTRSFTGMITQ